MPTYIALLRGINVGGHKKVPMADLRRLLGSLGYTNVSTYLQSGNVVFDAPDSPLPTLAAGLEQAIADGFGFPVRVLLLTHADLARAIAGNPLAAAVAEPTRFHVAFLSDQPSKEKLGFLELAAFPNVEVAFGNRVIYVWYREGVQSSKLTLDLLERRLGVAGTMRNWNTVTKLRDATT